MKTKNTATGFALLAAGLYALNIPLSKLFLQQVQPGMMAAFLYLGAGFGLLLWGRITGQTGQREPLTRKEMPYILGMILLDVAAPLLLMLGLRHTNAANASLLNNFEIVATSVIALVIFKEAISRKLTLAIVLVCLASILLSAEGRDSFQFHTGSLLVLGAACCWGLENNCTRMLSHRSSVQITTVKGIFSGMGSLLVAFLSGENLPLPSQIPGVAVLGFVAYGLSINFYIKAQKELGAAKTSAYYSVAPFLGVLFGILILGEKPRAQFYLGLGIMLMATVLMVKDTITLQHTHVHTHTHCHEHAHGEMVHTHEHTHTHAHVHVHGEDEVSHQHSHRQPEQHDHSHS